MSAPGSNLTDTDTESDELPLLSAVVIPGTALAELNRESTDATTEPVLGVSELEALINALGPVFNEELEDRINQALEEELTRILTGALEQLRQRLRERMRAELTLGLNDLLQSLLADARQR